MRLCKIQSFISNVIGRDRGDFCRKENSRVDKHEMVPTWLTSGYPGSLVRIDSVGSFTIVDPAGLD
jgi:hypothetical protein